jgi:hypothetical protein
MSTPAAALAAADPMSTNIFTIVGHGEDTFIELSERDTVPDGYTIVTLTKFADVTKISDVCQILRLLSNEDNRILLSDPIKNKAKIQGLINHNIRIYNSGKKYPKLTISLLADWWIATGGKRNYKQIVQSGVQAFPIESPDVPTFIDITEEEIANIKSKYTEIDKHIDWCGKFIHCFPQDLLRTKTDEYKRIIYHNSLIPKADEIKQLHVPPQKTLKDILSQLGRGIYYFIPCRAIPSQTELHFKTIKDVLDFSFDDFNDSSIPDDVREQIPQANDVIKNISNEINEEEDYVEKLSIFLRRIEEIPRPVLNFMYKKYIGKDYVDVPTSFPTELEYLNNVSRVRAHSNAEQVLGGTRKTSKARKASKAHRTNKTQKRRKNLRQKQ